MLNHLWYGGGNGKYKHYVQEYLQYVAVSNKKVKQMKRWMKELYLFHGLTITGEDKYKMDNLYVVPYDNGFRVSYHPYDNKGYSVMDLIHHLQGL